MAWIRQMNDILTVSQLNEHIKGLLEETFETLWVEGEVSNLRRPGSGHVYFTLKDEKSQIRAVYFRQFGYGRPRPANFELEDGVKVLCRCRLGVYAPRGEYQLIVESVEPLGIGALQKAFEQLKARLAAEGLFEDSRKKPIPFIPHRIGVVTSPTGAVIRDILHVTARRFPSVNILIAPARVQGAEAAGELISALRRLEKSALVDVIIIARGGGSLEDLAPFNDEGLARAIYGLSVPVISAVGHETDFTICDFVADLRAPTPSAAAELVVPDRADLLEDLNDLRARLSVSTARILADRRRALETAQIRFKDPRRFLDDYRLTLDDLGERLRRSMHLILRDRIHGLARIDAQLASASPARLTKEKKILLAHLTKNLQNACLRLLAARRERLTAASALLSSLSPLAVLKRGYSITRLLPSGEILKTSETLMVHDSLHIAFAKGSAVARVEKITGG